MTSRSAKDLLRSLVAGARRALGRKEAYYVALVLVLLFGLLQALASYELAKTADTYRSDEIWYVSSARNVLRDVFGTSVEYRVNGTPVYTVFLVAGYASELVRSKVEEAGGWVVKGDYGEVLAIAVAYPGPAEVLAAIPGVRSVVSGFPYPDRSGIDAYLNLEHPPLGKLLIGLSMRFCGDSPICWRLPSIASSAVVVVAAGLACLRLFGPLGGVVAAAVGYLDPLTTAMGSVAMLDVFLAALTALAVLSLAYGRLRPAVLLLALSVNIKYSGLFTLVGLYAYMRWRGDPPTKALAPIALALALVTLVVHAPYLYALGPERLLNEFVVALRWHTTSRPAGPPPSNPIEWVLGLNPFYISIDPDIAARGAPWVYAPALIAMVLAVPLLSVLSGSRLPGPLAACSLLGVFFFLGYAALMALGNRTLYSFYFVHFSPIGYVLFVLFLEMILVRPGLVDSSTSLYWTWFRLLARGEVSWIPLPRELGLLASRVPSETRPRLLLVAGVAGVSLSLLLHLDFGQAFKLFADMPFALLAAPALEPARLMGAQGLFLRALSAAGVSSNAALLVEAVFALLAINELLLLLSRLPGGLSALGRPLYAIPLATLLVYSCYDGSSVSVFFFLLSLNLLTEGKELLGGATLALATGNPMILVVSLILTSTIGGMAFGSYLCGVAVLLALAPYALGVAHAHYLSSLIDYFREVKAASIYSLALGVAGDHVVPVGVILAAVVAFLVALKAESLPGATVPDRALLLLLAAAALFPNVLPQWLLLLLLMAMAPRKVVGRLAIADVCNALVVATWFYDSEIMQALFKYQSPSPYGPFSMPVILSSLRTLALLTILVWALHRVGVRRRAAGEARAG